MLKEQGIEIIRSNKKIIISEEHKGKISISNKGKGRYKKGYKQPKKELCKNIASHMLFEIEYDFFLQFDDLNKITHLSRTLLKNIKRKSNKKIDVDFYKNFILNFYYDTQYNNLYDKWIENNKNKWLTPSLDHIIPVSKGGTDEINNIQFLSWFENRCKTNMSINEWKIIKEKINYYLT